MSQPSNTSFGNEDQREILRRHFTSLPAEQHIGGWDKMWQQSVTPWDRQIYSPALLDTLIEKSEILGSPVHHEARGKRKMERKKALVPGCGRGYDVLLFASYGYDAYGVDGSPTAIDGAKQNAAEHGDDPSKYPVHDPEIGRGQVEFLLNDFFKDDFLADTDGGEFDIIYDYTFLCALPRELRPSWAKRMSELLSPMGHLICLEFPLHKPPNSGGPPHGLTAALYDQLFRRPGRDVRYDADGYIKPDPSVKASENCLTRVARWKAERTHEAGKGTDHVSIWTRP